MMGTGKWMLAALAGLGVVAGLYLLLPAGSPPEVVARPILDEADLRPSEADRVASVVADSSCEGLSEGALTQLLDGRSVTIGAGEQPGSCVVASGDVEIRISTTSANFDRLAWDAWLAISDREDGTFMVVDELPGDAHFTWNVTESSLAVRIEDGALTIALDSVALAQQEMYEVALAIARSTLR